jgi:hypothetical protein
MKRMADLKDLLMKVAAVAPPAEEASPQEREKDTDTIRPVPAS